MHSGATARAVPAFLFAVVVAAQEAAAPPPIPWRTDFAAARAAAREQHKPLFVVFRCER